MRGAIVPSAFPQTGAGGTAASADAETVGLLVALAAGVNGLTVLGRRVARR